MNKTAISLFLAPVLLCGCAGQHIPAPEGKTQAPAPQDDRPAWVMKGSGPIKENGVTVIYGVGIAEDVNNAYAQRKMADTRALAAVTSTLRTTITAMTMDFTESRTNLAKGTSEETQTVSHIVQSVTEETLSNCYITDRWQDPKDNTLYAYAKIMMDGQMLRIYRDQLKLAVKAGTLPLNKDTADKAFAELDAQIGKLE